MIAPLGITYSYLANQRKIIKRKVKHQIIDGINRSELVYLKFSLADSQSKLNWKHAKEFEYKGEMYDIVEKEIIGDSIAYWLWWDHEETALNKQLSGILAGLRQNNRDLQKHEQLFVSMLKLVYLENENNFLIEPDFREIRKSPFSYRFILSPFFQNIPSPPP